jgi:HK97 family phage prohead protease
VTVTAPTELQHREFQIRATNAEAREFTGIGVPYGEEIEHWFGRETFDPGSVEGADTARVLWQHREPIGVIVSTRETDGGLEVTGRLSRTARGDEALTLLKDGVIRSLSIGFVPIEHVVETRDDGSELIRWTRVRGEEFSLVTFPAYDGAAISDVRHQTPKAAPTPKGNTVTEALTRDDLRPIENSIEDFQRQLSLLPTAPGAPEGSQWRSMGDFLKAVAKGDDAAVEFHRAYTGATTDDTIMKDSFVGDFIRLVSEKRRIVEQFSKGSLPSTGMTVDYYQLDVDNTAVAKQAAEGDNLPYGEIKLKPANSVVDTYGGWTELTRQAIERATVPALNTTLRAMGLRYARVTNAAVAAAYRAIIDEHLASADADAALEIGATPTTDDWLDAIVDAALAYEERGYSIGGLNASVDVFKSLIHLKDGDNRLMKVYGDGMNQVGELNLSQVSGNLAGVKVTLLPNTTGNVASFYDPLAIETLESAGAPAQLQDENIINLSKQFSIYGHQAVIVPFKDAILPIKFA